MDSAKHDHHPFVSSAARGADLIRRYALFALLPALLLGAYYSLTYHVVNQSPGETGLAALNLLKTGVIGNPYVIPTGPTAHAAPGTAGMLAVIYAIFNGNTTSARIAQSLLATALYLGGVVLVIRYCYARGLCLSALVTALLITCVLPVHLFASVVYYRQWDQPVAAFLIAALVLVWLAPGALRERGFRRAILIAVIGGLGGLFAPILPIVACIAELDVGWKSRAWRPALVGLVLIVASLTPWAMRNQQMLGNFILTRSNFGLELAVGNRDGATGIYDLTGVADIHPHDSVVAARRVAAIGEVAYMAEMKKRAMAWITAHPTTFIKLSLTRARLLFFPKAVDNDPLFDRSKILVIWLTSFLMFAMLGVVVAMRLPVLPWIACIALPLGPYLLTHTSERYAFPTYFAAVCLIATGVDVLAQRRRPR